jgi:hypothetical protein
MLESENLLNELVTVDIDQLLERVSDLRPSDLSSIASIAFNQLSSEQLEDDRKQTLLAVIQTILVVSPSSVSADSSENLEIVLQVASKLFNDADRSRAFYVALILTEELIARRVRFSRSLSTLLAPFAQKYPTAKTILDRIRNERKRYLGDPIRTDRTFDMPYLEFDQAIKNVIADVEQDWYRDPFKWPELSSVNPESLGKRLKSSFCGWSFAMDVPKQREGSRPALIVNPLDRVALQCLADQLSLSISRNMPEWVFGWRLDRQAPRRGHYASNSREWKLFRKRLKSLSRNHRYVLKIDVASFFESINTEQLLSRLGRKYRKVDLLGRLSAYFDRLQTRRNGAGLPQRSLASSVLAQESLRSVDRYISRVASEISPARWMDDIWLFGNSHGYLWDVCQEIEGILDCDGLKLNPTKTELIEAHSDDSDLIASVSGGGESSSDNEESFAERILELMEQIGEAPRSEISFFLKYSGSNSHEVRRTIADRLSVETLQHSGHVADKFADFIKEQNIWEKFLGWYLSFVRRNPDQHDWLLPTWARMFPASSFPSALWETAILDGRYPFRNVQASLKPTIVQHLVEGARRHPALKALVIDWISEGESEKEMFVIRSLVLAAKALNKPVPSGLADAIARLDPNTALPE